MTQTMIGPLKCRITPEYACNLNANGSGRQRSSINRLQTKRCFDHDVEA